jgi:predicted metal-dependent enzyme (double-stranded beta helix superfamily)
MLPHSYSVKAFMTDARRLLESGDALGEVQQAIGERLVRLSDRDDLTTRAAHLGPSDASDGGYLLWREPPHFTLALVRFHEHYRSPVHDHGTHWVVAAGYRGVDRWDFYERLDGREQAGHARVELRDQVVLEQGTATSLPAPPRSIHAHNNLYAGDSLELIFSAAKPVPAQRRFIYDLDESTCQPSWFEVSSLLVGEHFPPQVTELVRSQARA